MESDDEWITLDNLWMDMSECFQDDEEIGTSNKRKRGPRNFKYGRKDKVKAHNIVGDDGIGDLTLDRNEENEGEKELDKVVMEESDDSSFDGQE
ncbi:hypothetical protein M5689_007388 [Euphorbia peplus]|nr:hypothetical protein M5689_007388 [Euphorbia peplus]